MKPVLYVSHSKRELFYYNDASARYRCVFPAEELIANGETAHVIHFSQIDKLQLSDYRKIIFHRPQYSFKLWRTIRTAQKNQIEHWVDFDDLLFCPELSNTSAAVQSGKMSASLAKKHAQRYLKALQLFTHCQVSTDALADELAKQNKYTIKVSYNKIPERWVKQADCIPAQERLQKKIIRYLPGTSHHKHDFAHVEEFLAQLLHDNPDYHLNIIGDLEFDSALFPSAQISQTPFQPFEQLPSLINDSWIIIAPLVDNIFNRCKSGLKFWEGGLFGIPVISSPLKDIERFENIGMCINDDIHVWDKFITSMEVLENYATASAQAKETSQQAFFTQPTCNHRHLYLKLTSEFGPRWPADIINPTSTTNKKLLETYKAITQSDLNDNPDDASGQNKEMLLSLANKSIKNDLPPIKHTAIRKLKKLTASPKSFFKDSKYFKSLSSKN
jgi:hypothetical protein